MKFQPTINFYETHNFLCGRLGMLGFSTAFIQRRTGLSQGQIIYRLHKLGIKRREYRDGQSALARFVVQRTERAAIAYTDRAVKLLKGKK